MMAVSAKKAESEFRNQNEKCDQLAVQNSLARQDVRVHTNSYVLNKIQALRKKCVRAS